MSEQEVPANEAANGAGDAAAERLPDPGFEIEGLKAQATSYMEGWQRERAEFANYKRRVEQQQRDSYQNASAEVLKKVIPIVDDFGRSVANIPTDLKNNPWASGTAMILRKMNKMLEEFGVTLIDPQGELFDPNLHEAVMTEDSDAVESGHVIEVLQKGYVAGDRLLRPALVKVAR